MNVIVDNQIFYRFTIRCERSGVSLESISIKIFSRLAGSPWKQQFQARALVSVLLPRHVPHAITFAWNPFHSIPLKPIDTSSPCLSRESGAFTGSSIRLRQELKHAVWFLTREIQKVSSYQKIVTLGNHNVSAYSFRTVWAKKLERTDIFCFPEVMPDFSGFGRRCADINGSFWNCWIEHV